MSETPSFLNELNPQQRQAVTAGPGQVLVLAGPGSGKTRVLTYRIAYLVQAEQVRPYNILAVTFTNKAAREMEARLEKLLGEEARDLWLGTFHSVCARLLRREVEQLPLKPNFAIMDSDDQETLVKQALRDLRLDEKVYRPSSVHAAISRAKNELIQAKDYPRNNYRDEVVARVYQRYQEKLIGNNSLDFDDLLMYAVLLLEEHPMIREKYSSRFHHILVDEFQDTNGAQYQLLRLLAEMRGNLFVVGDEDQSIYRWRGADYRNVLRYEEDYPQCQKVLLEQNYRSTQNLLDTARAVIDHNLNRTPKKLRTDRGTGDPISLYEAEDDRAEAAYVVDTIRRAVSIGQVKASEFAVMYRTNAQSRLLEEAFMSSGMAYRLVGAQRFYGRREVKDLISYLRLVQNPADDVSLSRVINVPPRGIGDKTLMGLQSAAQQIDSNAGEVLMLLGKEGDQSPFWKSIGRGAPALADFGAMLSVWRASLPDMTLPELFDRIIAETHYQAYIDDGSEEGTGRWENVQELRRLAFEYEDHGLIAFLENLALVSDQDTVPEQASAPTLLTLHAAKGLEFGQVFIIGLDDGILPHSRSLDEPEEMAEERRLFYVGITRARNKLYLVRANRRSTYGSYEESLPSRFLKNIPDGLVQRQGLSGIERRSRAASWSQDTRTGSGSSWGRGDRASQGTRRESMPTRSPSQPLTRRDPTPEPVQPAYTAPTEVRFQAGMRVRHPKWGEGLVLSARIDGPDELVEIMFEGVGPKLLIAALANLEIL